MSVDQLARGLAANALSKGFAKQYFPIGCRGSGGFNKSGLSAQSAKGRSRHILPYGAQGIQLVYGGFKLNPAEATITDITQLHVGIEPTWGVQNGWDTPATNADQVIKKVSAGGAQDMILPPGGLLFCDMVPLTVAVGAAIGLRTWTNSSSSAVLNRYILTSGIQEYGTKGAVSDQSITGTFPTGSSTDSLIAPFAILGIAADGMKHNSLAIIGDSIDWGSTSLSNGTQGQDTLDADGNAGWVERSLANKIPFTNLGVPGDGFKYLMTNANGGTGRVYRLAAIAKMGYTHCLLKLGTNDDGTYTATQIQNNWIALVREIQALGLKVIAVTPPPKSTSSDFFASQQNVGSTIIRDFCIWLRANAVQTYGCSQLIDLNALLVDGSDATKWNLSLTGTIGAPPTYDGTHFSQLGLVWVAASGILTASMIA